jgi:hypothetical protein
MTLNIEGFHKNIYGDTQAKVLFLARKASFTVLRWVV